MKVTLSSLLVAGALAFGFAHSAQAETFDGPDVGTIVGDEQAEVASSIDGASIDAEATRYSFVFGGYAQDNFKATDRIVIGTEAGITSITDDRVITTSGGQALTFDPRVNFDLSASSGSLVTDKTFVYDRDRTTNQGLRDTLNDALRSVNLDGWQFEGGAEYAITGKIAGHSESRLSDVVQNRGDYDRHQVLVGISHRF